MKKILVVHLTCAMIMPIALQGQPKKQNSDVLQLDPAVRTGRLSNGFTYYIRHNEEPQNRVIMYLVNKVGSVLEDEDQRGLAHFMEHMNFNGTKHFPHNDLIDYLQKAGVRFGADINAYTSFDETVYELPIPSDKPEILKNGLEIMRDWANEALLDPVEIDKERGVVLEEKRLGKGSGERMRRIYWPIILNNSRYAVRMPIGLDTVLGNFKRPVIERFYKDWYRPDLQALIIVGDINADSLEKVVRHKFSDLKNPVHQRVRTKYTVPLSGKNQFVAVTDKEMPSTEAEVIIKHSQPRLKTDADYRAYIIRDLFNQMLSERYSELSRQADPPFIQGNAGISGFMGGLDIYDASVVAKPKELEKGIKAAWRETERVKRFGFTATELERAKTAYLNNAENDLKEKNKTNSERYVAELQNYFLKGTSAPGIEIEYRLIKKDLPTIILEEVNSLAADYITNANRDILISGPDQDKAILPTEATVNNWLKSVDNERLLPYVDDVGTKTLLLVQPVGGKITSQRYDKDIHTTALTLSNGVKVILKPTDYKNDEIQFSAFARGGSSLSSDADYQSAAHAVSIISAAGLANYNPTQLDKYLEEKQVNVSPFISERFEGINGSSTPKDLEAALQMVYAYFTEPRLDTAIFRGMMQRSIASLANRSASPNNVFSDSVSAVLGNYNIRRTGPSIAKLYQINADSAYKFYRQRFVNASGFTFIFVGSIDTNTIKPLLEKYLGSLPTTAHHEQAKDLGIHIPEGKIIKNIYKGSEPKSTVLLAYSGTFDYNLENKIKLDALKETLEIRLLQRLREDESGVYSPGVFVNTSKYSQARYSFIIQFGCAPQNVDKLIASTLDEISKLKINGPLQENLDKWRAETKSSRESQMKTNGFWLNYLNGQLQNEDDIDQVTFYNYLLEKVSVKDEKEAADEYLSGNNYIRIVLLPETGIAIK